MKRKAKTRIYIDLETALATFDRASWCKIGPGGCSIHLDNFSYAARVRRKKCETFAEMVIRAATKVLENQVSGTKSKAPTLLEIAACQGCGANARLREYKGFTVCRACALGMKEITVQ